MTAVCVTATGLFLAVTLVGERTDSSWRIWPKAAASLGYILTAISAGAPDTGYGRWVLAALCLSWIGDVALVSRGHAWFMTGLVAFAVAHLAYIVAFSVLGMRAVATIVAALVLAALALAVGRRLLPHVQRRMVVPVVAYLVVITAMVAAAAGAASEGAPWPVLPAALAFYLSDLGVARHQFVTPGFENRAVGLPLYYGAQVLFALSTGMV